MKIVRHKVINRMPLLQGGDTDARFEEGVCSMDPLDRVEAAFNKFDTDGNGYIDWEEFKQVVITTL